MKRAVGFETYQGPVRLDRLQWHVAGLLVSRLSGAPVRQESQLMHATSRSV